jgi:hypothetical protein
MRNTVKIRDAKTGRIEELVDGVDRFPKGVIAHEAMISYWMEETAQVSGHRDLSRKAYPRRSCAITPMAATMKASPATLVQAPIRKRRGSSTS